LDELAQLALTAGASVVGRMVQKRESPHPAHLLGQGKVEELALRARELRANLVIFLQELRAGQERNLSKLLGIKVIDRQALILDIFAQRAHTREGKLQVELAQLTYLLPRLAGLGIRLSRLGGGIGTRGPGETMLETDRRHIRRRITTVRRELEGVRGHRGLLRQSRHKRGFFLAALVGYTNAGKSTLLNTLTGSRVLVEDKLFATLDPSTRRMRLPDGRALLLVDTVGFIRDLPHDLVAAFRATLEEVQEADLVLHVLDISHPNYPEQWEVVRGVLEDLAADNKPILHVLNKIDLLPSLPLLEERSAIFHPRVCISALEGAGFETLKETLVRMTLDLGSTAPFRE